MNSSNAHLYLPLVQALSEGKIIQRDYQYPNGKWQDITFDLIIDLPPDHYRIKPEPRVFYLLENTISKSKVFFCRKEELASYLKSESYIGLFKDLKITELYEYIVYPPVYIL